MARKDESDDEISGLRDLTPEQREDIEALCDEGFMPSQISRRTGVPTRVVADARRSWARQKELEVKQNQPSVQLPATPTTDMMQRLNDMTTTQLQQTLLQEQIEALRESNRHRRESNKLEERERHQELRERETMFMDDRNYPEQSSDSELYDFETNPIGATMKFVNELKAKPDRSSDANKSPTSDDSGDLTKPFTDEFIASYVAKLPQKTVGQAIAAVGTPYEPMVVEALKKNAPGISEDNINRVLSWLKKQKPTSTRK